MDDKDHGRTISRADFFNLCRHAEMALPDHLCTHLREYSENHMFPSIMYAFRARHAPRCAGTRSCPVSA